MKRKQQETTMTKKEKDGLQTHNIQKKGTCEQQQREDIEKQSNKHRRTHRIENQPFPPDKDQ